MVRAAPAPLPGAHARPFFQTVFGLSAARDKREQLLKKEHPSICHSHMAHAGGAWFGGERGSALVAQALFHEGLALIAFEGLGFGLGVAGFHFFLLRELFVAGGG